MCIYLCTNDPQNKIKTFLSWKLYGELSEKLRYPLCNILQKYVSVQQQVFLRKLWYRNSITAHRPDIFTIGLQNNNFPTKEIQFWHTTPPPFPPPNHFQRLHFNNKIFPAENQVKKDIHVGNEQNNKYGYSSIATLWTKLYKTIMI